MKTKTMSYAELAEKVGDAVLFNKATEYDVDPDWVDGLIESPLIREKLDAEEELALTDEATNFGEDPISLSIVDYADGIYQTYAISPYGAEFLFNYTTEIISYSEKLDLFLWHVTHFGTAWSGVHTEIAVYEGDLPDWYASGSEDIIKYKYA